MSIICIQVSTTYQLKTPEARMHLTLNCLTTLTSKENYNPGERIHQASATWQRPSMLYEALEGKQKKTSFCPLNVTHPKLPR